MHGIYTQERARWLGHGDGCCTLCLGTPKTPEHIFYSCLKAQRGWAGNALNFESNPYESFLVDTSSFLDILDNGLSRTPTGISRLFVIFQTCWSLWLHKNNHVYQHRSPCFAPRINAEQVVAHLDATSRYTSSHKKRMRMQQAYALITPRPTM